LLAGISPVSYANHLVRIARMVHAGTDSSRMIWGTLAMARPAGLETRVLSILNPAVDRRPLCKREISILMAAVGLVTLPAASLRPTTAAAPQAPTSIGRTIGTSGTHQRQSAQPAKQIDTVILSPDKSYWPVAPSCVAVSELSNQTIVRCSWDHMRGSANGLFGDTIYSVSMPRTYPRLTGVSIDMDETMLQMGQAVGMMKDVMAVIRKVGECVSVSYPIAARARPDTHIREGAQCVSLYY
jgi:hypothetical protein